MWAIFRKLKHKAYNQFTEAGAPEDIALVAAIALARKKVFWVEPNPQQQSAIDECKSYLKKPEQDEQSSDVK